MAKPNVGISAPTNLVAFHRERLLLEPIKVEDKILKDQAHDLRIREDVAKTKPAGSWLREQRLVSKRAHPQQETIERVVAVQLHLPKVNVPREGWYKRLRVLGGSRQFH